MLTCATEWVSRSPCSLAVSYMSALLAKVRAKCLVHFRYLRGFLTKDGAGMEGSLWESSGGMG